MLLGLRIFQGPRFLAKRFVEQRVFVLESVQILEHWRTIVVETIIAPPLQIADLHTDLRQLECIGVYLNRAKLLHSHSRSKYPAELRGGGDGFLFQRQQPLKRDVQKVPATARGV